MCSPQQPLSCFPHDYSVSISKFVDDELTEAEIVPVTVTSVNGSDIIEVAGLRESTRYSAVLSSSNHFQFSIDDPVRSEEISFGEWSTSGCGLM